MRARDIVYASAQAGADTVGTDRFVKLTQHALNLVATEMATHVRDGERPGVLSAAEVVVDGKARLGAILVLEHRAVLAWTVGTLRSKNFEAVFPLVAVMDAAPGERPGGAMSMPRETLSIEAGATWNLVFANMFEGGRSIVPILAGLLTGVIRPIFEDDAGRT